MKRSLWLLALLCAGFSQAQSTYRWVDQAGRVHYGDRPPAPSDARAVQQRKYSAPTADKLVPYEMREAIKNFPATLYVTPDCAAVCKEGREYLNRRGIPFSEKSVATKEEIAALRERLGGVEPSVPVLQVGEKTSKGFLESAWAGLLDAAGYPKTPAKAADR